ncbi:MAG TPA: hypothetical protein VFT12_02485 [Thermoanaerobaculia bacterium]|nr:hypothetical protein [Thermoanaerobaculia bacterium]
MKRAIFSTLAGGAALVVWGMIFWAFLAPALGVFNALPDAAGVTRALSESDTPTGTYFMPWPRSTPEEFDRFVAQHKSGPFFRLSFVREGVDPNHPAKIATGVLQYLVVAALAVVLVMLAGAATFRARFALVMFAGLMGTVFITLGDPVWFHLPWDYTAGVALYEVVAWALLALTTAAITPRRERV